MKIGKLINLTKVWINLREAWCYRGSVDVYSKVGINTTHATWLHTIMFKMEEPLESIWNVSVETSKGFKCPPDTSLVSLIHVPAVPMLLSDNSKLAIMYCPLLVPTTGSAKHNGNFRNIIKVESTTKRHRPESNFLLYVLMKLTNTASVLVLGTDTSTFDQYTRFEVDGQLLCFSGSRVLLSLGVPSSGHTYCS